MSLYSALQKVKSEEDVKDAYIKALGLKSVSKGLIDIQTAEMWFEAKDKPKSTYEMFTQLLHYVYYAIKKGDKTPPFLAVIDTQKAALMKTADIMPLFDDKAIKWGQDSSSGAKRSASKFTKDTLEKVSTYIGTHFVSFKIETHEQEFIDTVKLAIKSGDIVRIQITPDNLKQVFDKWVNLIGKEINGVAEADYALLFFADIMHDGKVSTHDLPAKLVHDGDKPFFLLNNLAYYLSSREGYRQFWAIYHKPPKAEYRNYLLERRDSLIPIEERSFKGAYYTPLAVVDKAYDLLTATLGKNWQKNYIVWDMCCGVGNLEVKHSNPRNVFMSTLDKADIDVMKASKICVSATRFQYDYLNDDISDDGNIDYSLTHKVPKELQQAIKDGKKILVLINPPYAEATNRGYLGEDVTGKENKKTSVAKTKIALHMNEYGKASNELFAQFLARIAQEIPNAIVAMFSTLKYVNAQSFEKFRAIWNAQYLNGFVIHNQVFDGLIGKFPIGFLIWRTDNQANSQKVPITDITVDVLDKQVKNIGEKQFYNFPNHRFLNVWFKRPRSNGELVLPIKNTTSPATAKPSVSTWSDNAIAYMHCNGNDPQQTEQLTTLYSSVFSAGHGFYITPENLWQAAIVFSVRRLIKPTWLNDRDQFLQPSQELSDEFKNDCLMWMLFNRCNKTASANDLEWSGKKWSIVNHFIPFTEEEVKAPERFESDFMVKYLKGKKLSKEAKAVLSEGKKLWQAYFAQTDDYKTRQELKLNRADVGWYQIRKALEARSKEGVPVSFEAFKTTYEALSEKLRPQVFELGFMR